MKKETDEGKILVGLTVIKQQSQDLSLCICVLESRSGIYSKQYAPCEQGLFYLSLCQHLSIPCSQGGLKVIHSRFRQSRF